MARASDDYALLENLSRRRQAVHLWRAILMSSVVVSIAYVVTFYWAEGLWIDELGF